ncbi:MAG: DUF2950 domain-containing protein [Rudaea sp.]|nr:DUF2950 domain-containing protein [Rudaea sp.]
MNSVIKRNSRIGGPKCIAHFVASVVGLALIFSMATATAATQQTFDSPQAAVDALVRAVSANDETALYALFGPGSDKLLSSGDKTQDVHNRSVFSKAYQDAHRLDVLDNALATLVIGKDEWPMPIPLVKERGRWRFDTKKGADEILARRIGRNELSTMKVCLAIVDAEREYATRNLDADGVPQYTSHFVSRQGKRDGLYWPTAVDAPLSPLGALLAAAADEGYSHPGSNTLEPYHGYYYRFLTRQGKSAAGGARDYEIRGKLIGGFALLAYPARYGDSGIMSFIVNHDGVLFEQNLGPGTYTAARGITVFDPDSSWKKVDAAQ